MTTESSSPADADRPPYVTQRMRYFDSEFLDTQAFVDEQSYHVDRQARHEATLHTAGVLEGLVVTQKDANTVTVTQGSALDEQGNQILLWNPEDGSGGPQVFPLSVDRTPNATFLVDVLFVETPGVPDGNNRNTRFVEEPANVLAINAQLRDGAFLLATVITDGNGDIANVDTTTGVRYAGLRLPGLGANSAATVRCSATDARVEISSAAYVRGGLGLEGQLFFQNGGDIWASGYNQRILLQNNAVELRAAKHVILSGGSDGNSTTWSLVVHENGDVGIGLGAVSSSSDPLPGARLNVKANSGAVGLQVTSSGGSPLLKVQDGGPTTVSGGLTVSSAGILVTEGGLTVSSGGLAVSDGDVALSGSGTLNVSASGGLTVSGGDVTVTSGRKLTVAGLLTAQGGLNVTGNVGIGTSAPSTTLEVKGSFKATSADGSNYLFYNGMDVFLTVGSRGSGGRALVHDTNNWLTVNYSNDFAGVKLSGPVICNGALTAQGGLLTASGGLTISNGLAISSGGLTVPSGGLTVTGGNVTIGDSKTLTVSGRLTAQDGLSVSAGSVTTSLGAAVASPETLRMIRGTVSSTGGVSAGSGFTISKSSTGRYDISFTTAFNGAPSVVVTQNYNGTKNFNGGDTRDNAVVIYVDPALAQIKTGNNDGTASDRAFHFIAVGT